MSLYNRVIWSEGMFLRPQHFQQQDRHFDDLIRRLAVRQKPNSWGFRHVDVDRSQLQFGKLAITACEGVMPDGTLFSVPEEYDAPPVRELAASVRDQVVYLGIPVDPSGRAAEPDKPDSDVLARWSGRTVLVEDLSDVSVGNKADIRVGRLRLRLLLHSEQRDGYHCIPVVQVVQVAEDKKIVLDAAFVPSCIDFRASQALVSFVRELHGLVHQRAEAIAARVAGAVKGSVAEVADFLLLQLLNRIEPIVAHLAGDPDSAHGIGTGLHPEELFRFLIAIAGELSTFTSDVKRPISFPLYNHDDLTSTFTTVEIEIRRALGVVWEPTALEIPLEELKYGVRRAFIHDLALLDTASFVLEVHADMETELLGQAFRKQSKIGPIEQIRELVNLALPGIPLRQRAVAPRQIPFHAGALYFDVEKGGEMWKALEKSGGLALHVADKFPNLRLGLWAIKR